MTYEHRFDQCTTPGNAPIDAVLPQLAGHADKMSAEGWELVGSPVVLNVGGRIVGSQGAVVWIIPFRRAKAAQAESNGEVRIAA